MELIGGSLTQREDAISRDYRIAFSMGPIAIGDVSAGVYSHAWRVQANYDEGLNSGSVVLARQNDTDDAWLPNVELFSYSGAPIKEVDLAFDQNGNTVISADRDTGEAGASHVWLWWFNPLAGTFIFEDMTVGRTPRLLLDDPESLAESDLLLFYLNDSNQRVAYRVQRELYDDEHLVPVDKWYDTETGVNVLQTNTENLFLEELARSKDYRLHIVASLRNVVTGRFQLIVSETVPYPIYPVESQVVDTELTLGEIVTYVLPSFPGDSMEVASPLQLLNIVDLIIEFSQWPDDNYEAAAELLLLDKIDLIIEHATDGELDSRSSEVELQTFTVTLYVIEAPVQDEDNSWESMSSLSTLNKVAV